MVGRIEAEPAQIHGLGQIGTWASGRVEHGFLCGSSCKLGRGIIVERVRYGIMTMCKKERGRGECGYKRRPFREMAKVGDKQMNAMTTEGASQSIDHRSRVSAKWPYRLTESHFRPYDKPWWNSPCALSRGRSQSEPSPSSSGP